MGLTISSLFGRLFGKKQMRILMGKSKTLLRILTLNLTLKEAEKEKEKLEKDNKPEKLEKSKKYKEKSKIYETKHNRKQNALEQVIEVSK